MTSSTHRIPHSDVVPSIDRDAVVSVEYPVVLQQHVVSIHIVAVGIEREILRLLRSVIWTDNNLRSDHTKHQFDSHLIVSVSPPATICACSQIWLLFPVMAMFQPIGFRSFSHRTTVLFAVIDHP